MTQMSNSDEITSAVVERFADAIREQGEILGVPTLYVDAGSIVDLCAYAKSDERLDLDYLMSLTAVDWPDRFDVVYHLYSIRHKHYLTIKVKLDKAEPTIASVTPVWKAANWQEREAYDMFGIEFEGHPDLTRILLEPDWEGFPLRKDYVEK